jgi:hypothetical protein
MKVGDWFYVKYTLDMDVLAGNVGVVVSVNGNRVDLRAPLDGSYFSWTLDFEEKLEPVEPEKVVKFLPLALELFATWDKLKDQVLEFEDISYKSPYRI